VPAEIVEILDRHVKKMPGIKNRSDLVRQILLDFVKNDGVGKRTIKKIERKIEKSKEWREIHAR